MPGKSYNVFAVRNSALWMRGNPIFCQSLGEDGL
jgi:hypothetical protein